MFTSKLLKTILDVPNVFFLDLHRLVEESFVDVADAIEQPKHRWENLEGLVVLEVYLHWVRAILIILDFTLAKQEFLLIKGSVSKRTVICTFHNQIADGVIDQCFGLLSSCYPIPGNFDVWHTVASMLVLRWMLVQSLG